MPEGSAIGSIKDMRSDAGPRRKGASLSWDILYAGGLIVSTPYLLYHLLRTGKYRRSFPRRMWPDVRMPPHPKRIWIHAVSVGEVNAAWTLVRELKAAAPDVHCVISTITETGHAVAGRRYGAENVFYLPFDFSRPVRKVFDAVRPAALVLIELEIWPNLVAEAKARGIPVVVANGRITPRSAAGYRRFKSLLGATLREIDAYLVQSEEYAARFRDAGAPADRIRVTGQMKYDAVSATVEPGAREAVRGEFGIPPEALLLIGGSTHRGEEAALLAAYARLRGEFPRLRLALVPRHPERFDEAEAAIRQSGAAPLRLTALRGGKACWDMAENLVLLVDAMGVLVRLYQAADAAFVGGSLIPHGGQNPMEPAGCGIPALFGPHMFNFQEAAEMLLSAKGCRQVRSADELPDALREILADADLREEMGRRAREAILARQGASATNARIILDMIGETPGPPP
ncbi:MAG: 3-deoxy-D-manno-octulosonic acid transferase [Planctomycetota bacterium]|nr:3-deoxy-D-manno-octulosonic acid transferase [Planctomycetota bacterium]